MKEAKEKDGEERGDGVEGDGVGEEGEASYEPEMDALRCVLYFHGGGVLLWERRPGAVRFSLLFLLPAHPFFRRLTLARLLLRSILLLRFSVDIFELLLMLYGDGDGNTGTASSE